MYDCIVAQIDLISIKDYQLNYLAEPRKETSREDTTSLLVSFLGMSFFSDIELPAGLNINKSNHTKQVGTSYKS
jgi:hypothetical protein